MKWTIEWNQQWRLTGFTRTACGKISQSSICFKWQHFWFYLVKGPVQAFISEAAGSRAPWSLTRLETRWMSEDWRETQRLMLILEFNAVVKEAKLTDVSIYSPLLVSHYWYSLSKSQIHLLNSVVPCNWEVINQWYNVVYRNFDDLPFTCICPTGKAIST